MSDNPQSILLSNEQMEALDEKQKGIFAQLSPGDQRFFAENFSAASLPLALERKWQAMQSRMMLEQHEQQARERAANGTPVQPGGLTLSEGAMGAAGVAGVVGMGALARKLAPEGKAAWRGVKPRDLMDPLVQTFARQPRTDIRFDAPTAEGTLHGVVLLRSDSGLLPALDVTLAPVQDTLEVTVSQISKQSLVETFKEGGQSLLELVKDALFIGWGHNRAGNLLDLAGQVMEHGADIAQAVNDLNLEDKAWEAIKRAADPIQAIYDQRSAVEREQRLRLEMAWDDYRSCPRCRVEFGTEDVDCRVCGTARPPVPEMPDPRKPA
jgi:hypothetical protein